MGVRALGLRALIVVTLGATIASPQVNSAPDQQGSITADPIARMRLRRGQVGVARARLGRELIETPDDMDLAAMYAEASARNGNYADAFATQPFARLADGYDARAIALDANVLRALGAPGDAAALRAEIQWADTSVLAGLEATLDAVDDHRSDGDLQAAWGDAMMAIAVAPDRGAPYAQLAEVLMDLDRWEEARAWFEVGNWMGPRSTYLTRAEVRWMIHDKRFDEARDVALAATQEDRTDLSLRALRVEAVTASGDPKTALTLVQMKRFEGTDHPQMMLAELHALEATGSVDAAAVLRERFRAIYKRPVLSSLGVRERP